MAANTTDANDAQRDFFREMRVKRFDSLLAHTIVAALTRLVQMATRLSNQVRGIIKTFGLVVPADNGRLIEKTFEVFSTIIKITLL